MGPLVKQSDRWRVAPRPSLAPAYGRDALFEYLERGKTLDEFLEQFPTGSGETAVAILETAKRGS